LPVSDAASARFINDIVVCEECDLGPDGSAKSHLEMYLAAMNEVDANTDAIGQFLRTVGEGHEVHNALENQQIPQHVRRFVSKTMSLATGGAPVAVAANFLYGREDAIPDMFSRLLKFWDQPEVRVPWFRYYLERHIALDGDEHGPAARKLLDSMVGGDGIKLEIAAQAALGALQARIELWDGILQKLRMQEESVNTGGNGQVA
jgi:hypothetical protein